MNKLKLGHIVYTASDKCMLDIGWVESVNPLVIQSRATKYDSITDPRRYGGVQYTHWRDTNKSVTAKEWRTLSYEKTTQEICDEIGVNYYMKKEIMHESEKIPSEWYCIEYKYPYCTDYYYDHTAVYKVLATDGKEALYSFYAYQNGSDEIIEKAIMAQDNAECAIKLLNKPLHSYCSEIINIFTVDNWVYSKEDAED